MYITVYSNCFHSKHNCNLLVAKNHKESKNRIAFSDLYMSTIKGWNTHLPMFSLLTSKVIYQAKISNDHNDEKKRYIGLTEPTLKTRYGNHVKSFKHRKYSKETELPKYIWELKDDNKVLIIKWKILKTITSRLNSNRFILCLSEKFFIVKNWDDMNLFKKKESEFISKCRHANKYMLQSVK